MPTTNATFNAIDNTITLSNPDGSKLTVDADIWLDGLKNSTPVAGRWWSTKALILLNDKLGNPLKTYGITTSTGAPSTAVITWEPSTKLLQERQIFTASPEFKSLSIGLLQKKAELDKAYTQAKQDALNEARAGKPYIEPNISQYTLSEEQRAEMARPYFKINAVLYLD